MGKKELGHERTVEDILEEMTTILEKAWSIPMTGGRSAVQAEDLFNLIQDIRLKMPAEIADARKIINDRRLILDEAKKEAEMTVRMAEERARKLVDHDEIVKQAQLRANELLSAAQMQVRELKKATGGYVDSVLQQTEEQLSRSLNEVHNKRAVIKGMKV